VFVTNRGLWEPLVMFFGLTNSPATFQSMMNNIFTDLIVEGRVIVYLDNIFIYSEHLEEHRAMVKEVLRILQENKLNRERLNTWESSSEMGKFEWTP
jgi:hypothetical protein